MSESEDDIYEGLSEGMWREALTCWAEGVATAGKTSPAKDPKYFHWKEQATAAARNHVDMGNLHAAPMPDGLTIHARHFAMRLARANQLSTTAMLRELRQHATDKGVPAADICSTLVRAAWSGTPGPYRLRLPPPSDRVRTYLDSRGEWRFTTGA